MNLPASKHFEMVDLWDVFNLDRAELPETLKATSYMAEVFGESQFRGMPFLLGSAGAANAIYLDKEAVWVELGGICTNYIVFLHTVEDAPTVVVEGLADSECNGNALGDHVSDYALRYDDGAVETVPILRRFAIQQGQTAWGASAFASVPACSEFVGLGNAEAIMLDRMPRHFGPGEVRTSSGRDRGPGGAWIYAIKNPHPDRPIETLLLTPCDQRSVVYAVSTTELEDHPLRFQPRRKLVLTLPEGLTFNAIDELDDVEIDLGYVISARRQLEYDHARWNVGETDVQPRAAENTVLVEYAAHPGAILYVGIPKSDPIAIPLADAGASVLSVAPAHRPVRVKVIDKASRNPVGVRIHFHGEAGEYLPPKGNHRKVNTNWFEDNYGEFANGANQYAYIRGECIVDLPLGTVYVEITRGYEITPIRESIEVTGESGEFTFELERVLDWRSLGWVSADTHVHFLSPSTAVLEGEAEDVNVVNVLASQWGELFTNVGDFDGKTTHTNTLSGNDGEFLARVGTENRMQILGHISLLGYAGEMIHPLCSGGPSESAMGDFQEVTMADWAERCIAQHGLVVMPHAPNPQCERVADVVLDVVNAIEFMTFTPYDVQLMPYAVADWYRFLNAGYHLPVVGGSDKMSASALLGGIRTYTYLGDQAFTYENWMRSTREGHTFVTVGPLVDMKVEGKSPGSQVSVSASGATVTVEWNVSSVRFPIRAIEVVMGGRTVHEERFDGVMASEGSVEVFVESSDWIAVRVRGGYVDEPGEKIAAHTSAVQVLTGDKPVYRQEDAVEMLKQIEGAIAYVDTIAARPDADRYRKMRLTLETAYKRLHARMHENGVFHEHSPLHDHGHEH